jgi:hypothetical protein
MAQENNSSRSADQQRTASRAQAEIVRRNKAYNALPEVKNQKTTGGRSLGGPETVPAIKAVNRIADANTVYNRAAGTVSAINKANKASTASDAKDAVAKKRAINAIRKDDKRATARVKDTADTLSSRNMNRVPAGPNYNSPRVPAGMTKRSPDRLEALNAHGNKAGIMYGDWIEGGGPMPTFRKPKK